MIRILAILLLVAGPALADGPADNVPEQSRPIPPKGKPVPEDQRKALEVGLAKLGKAVEALHASNDPKVARLVPDVEIYEKSVHYALEYDEFYTPEEVVTAKRMLDEGLDRANALLEKGDAPWTRATGTVWLAYRSKIDGSVQPYSLIVPESWNALSPHRHRLDVWFHGRGETRTEVFFYNERKKDRGEFTPEDAFVLHPYGRFCNAAKFAGEIDALEALADVQARYKIDEDRVAVRGFSMGGASTWHFAVHYADRWFAANPGAGFSETPRFLDVFQKEKLEPAWYEKVLWHWYDCPEVAVNLAQCPTVAYSGEIDNQKQAADVMAEALERLDMPLTHIIGPKTPHRYHPEAKQEVARRMEELARIGRERVPRRVRFVTYSLLYNRMDWITLDAMDEHWKPAKASALVDPSGRLDPVVVVQNVRVHPGNAHGLCPLDRGRPIQVHIAESSENGDSDDEGTRLTVPGPETDRSWKARFHKDGDEWKVGPLPENGLRKVHGLQGPIDDAFLDRFTFVMPSGQGAHPKVAAWVESERNRAVRRWRSQMRGDAHIKLDRDVTDADIAAGNLVLWGDPESNSVLKKIADKLPIKWDGDQIVAGDRKFPASEHVPILVYPNPLNPKKYVVLNSGFTYREYDDLNNARQVPRLPDWAIVDVTTPPNSRFPGKVVDADFFDDSWALKPPHQAHP